MKHTSVKKRILILAALSFAIVQGSHAMDRQKIEPVHSDSDELNMLEEEITRIENLIRNLDDDKETSEKLKIYKIPYFKDDLDADLEDIKQIEDINKQIRKRNALKTLTIYNKKHVVTYKELADRSRKTANKARKSANKARKLANRARELANRIRELASRERELDSKRLEIDLRKDELEARKEELESRKDELGSRKDELAARERAFSADEE